MANPLSDTSLSHGMVVLAEKKLGVFIFVPLLPHLLSVGISVGTNGILVFEHADFYLPCLLSHPRAISDWTHIAVVYTNNKVCAQRVPVRLNLP